MSRSPSPFIKREWSAEAETAAEAEQPSKRVKSEPLSDEQHERSLEIVNRWMDEGDIRDHLFPKLLQDPQTSHGVLTVLSFALGLTPQTLLHNKHLACVDIDFLRKTYEAIFRAPATTQAAVAAVRQVQKASHGSKIIKDIKLQIATILVREHTFEEVVANLHTVLPTVDKLRLFRHSRWYREPAPGQDAQLVLYTKMHALYLLCQIAEVVPMTEIRASGIKNFPRCRKLFEDLDMTLLAWLGVCYMEAKVWDLSNVREDHHFDVSALLQAIMGHRERLPGCMWAIYFKKSIEQLEIWDRQLTVIDGFKVFDMRSLRAYSHTPDPEAAMVKAEEVWLSQAEQFTWWED